jgi:hypothetical protein
MVVVPTPPPRSAVVALPVALTVVALSVAMVVVPIVVALGGRRRLSGRLRDDGRWSRGCDGSLRR